eukprot:TRINITY_DN76355_c0_g1_i1.p1 TRINITY_DN76355_c0_g1~~TRINITY_DN76355_c0_g1_i1.p1  ORF type:complete len:505 (+),score=118.05 TRINITY_DN76355_c0_g1_i1:56-1570(+)
MATAAQAAREFVGGPRVVQAAHHLLNSFPLRSLCEALVNARAEDAEPLVKALENLTEIEEVRPLFLQDDVKEFLTQGAIAPDPRLRLMVGKLLAQLAQGGEAAVTNLLESGLLSLCECLIVDDETGPAEAAAKAVLAAIKCSAGQQALLGASPGDGSSLAEKLQGRLQELPDVQRIRALALFVEVGRSSPEAFARLEQRGAFEKVLGAFLTDDLLLKLNAVELMDALGSYAAGQEYLGRAGLPERLAAELADPCCESSIRLCVTRLLGLVLSRAPSSAAALLPGREAPFPQSVAGLLNSRDPAEKLCALNAWADASLQLEGLTFFLRWTPLLQEVLSLAAAPQNEVAKGAMSAWATVLKDRSPPSLDNSPAAEPSAAGPDAELWDIAEQRLLPLVLKNLASKPFPDVRPHTWHLLAVLVRSRRAVQQAVPAEEMRTLLLDFQSETSTDARYEKHGLVKALMQSHSQWLENFLGEEVFALLNDYMKQGPYWVPRGAATAVGDNAA